MIRTPLYYGQVSWSHIYRRKLVTVPTLITRHPRYDTDTWLSVLGRFDRVSKFV